MCKMLYFLHSKVSSKRLLLFFDLKLIIHCRIVSVHHKLHQCKIIEQNNYSPIMSQSSREEQIFETPNVDSSSAEHKLATYKDAMVDRPANNRDRDEAISEVKLNPEAAFGVFNGKVFSAPKADYFSLADSIERRAESPLQRYARLRGELDELKTDLESIVEADTDKNSASSVWSALQHEVNDLSASAASLEAHKAFGLVRSNIANHERSLLSLVDNLKQLHVVGDEASDVKGGNNVGVDSSMLLKLERRVHYLETILGSAGNFNDINAASSAGKPTCPFPLLDAVSRLEERVTLLDVSELENIRAKCESVRNELDATLKSKSTLATESKIIDAAKQLSGLIGVADRVDAVAADLPNLVLRLKTLETVHSAVSSVNSRLTQMETDVRGLSGELASNKEVLSVMKQSIMENVATMQQNISAVDTKLTAK